MLLFLLSNRDLKFHQLHDGVSWSVKAYRSSYVTLAGLLHTQLMFLGKYYTYQTFILISIYSIYHIFTFDFIIIYFSVAVYIYFFWFFFFFESMFYFHLLRLLFCSSFFSSLIFFLSNGYLIHFFFILFFKDKVLVIDMDTSLSSSSSSSISLAPHALSDTQTPSKVPVPQGYGAPYLTAPWGQKILSTVYQSYVG